jgi:nucleoid DNA-binding protein
MDRLISRLAAKTKMPPAKAADGIDKLVHKIRTAVRKGETAELPGLGKFGPGTLIQFSSESPRGKKTQKGEPHGNHQRTTVQPASERSR